MEGALCAQGLFWGCLLWAELSITKDASCSALEIKLSGVSKLTALLPELLIFHVCWAPAYGLPAELLLPSLAKLTVAPGALSETLLCAGLKFSLSCLASWVETQQGDGMVRWPRTSRLKHPVPRVPGGLCVTAGEIPTQEGWERLGLS